jgi:2'-5' RNA ligase
MPTTPSSPAVGDDRRPTARDPRYFLALVPPEPLSSQVTALKMEMQAHYHSSVALKSPPHITLQAPFQWPLSDLNTLTSTLQTVAHTQVAVSVELRGFGTFPPRVIYVHVLPSPALMALQRAISTQLQQALALPRDRRSFHPHMTIAFRDLSKRAFQQAWPAFEQRPFTGQFTATALTLLRHRGHHWQIDRYYPLQPSDSL